MTTAPLTRLQPTACGVSGLRLSARAAETDRKPGWMAMTLPREVVEINGRVGGRSDCAVTVAALVAIWGIALARCVQEAVAQRSRSRRPTQDEGRT